MGPFAAIFIEDTNEFYPGKFRKISWDLMGHHV